MAEGRASGSSEWLFRAASSRLADVSEDGESLGSSGDGEMPEAQRRGSGGVRRPPSRLSFGSDRSAPPAFGAVSASSTTAAAAAAAAAVRVLPASASVRAVVLLWAATGVAATLFMVPSLARAGHPARVLAAFGLLILVWNALMLSLLAHALMDSAYFRRHKAAHFLAWGTLAHDAIMARGAARPLALPLLLSLPPAARPPKPSALTPERLLRAHRRPPPPHTSRRC